MHKFDTKVQYLKYRVLREVARAAFDGRLVEKISLIPREIIPGKVPTMRCCVYKERAILAERVRLALGGDRGNPNVIEVIDIACDDCPAGGYTVTENCRGCLAHRCDEVCPRGAIQFDERQKAHIDKSKCINCGRCAEVCPYGAVANHKRPCENACKIKAISSGEDGAACIDHDKCIQCGACVYQCPFGAISDKSYILDVVDYIKKSREGGPAVYAVIAPSVSSQFTYATVGQVVAGIHRLGFAGVTEAALGADMTVAAEAEEFLREGTLSSSCCPAYVAYVEKNFPALRPLVSHTPSPMVAAARYLKERHPGAKVVFIGPCTAKKAECMRPEVRPFVDTVITFEELQALFDSRDLDLLALPEETPDDASYFGRIFARGGGLSEALAAYLAEDGAAAVLRPCACDGIEQCRAALLRLSAGKNSFNFVEGMACTGGCIGGAGCLTHEPKDKAQVDAFGRRASAATVRESLCRIRK